VLTAFTKRAIIALVMEAESTSETSVSFYRTTLRNYTKGGNFPSAYEYSKYFIGG
jgi:hypothetical protein